MQPRGWFGLNSPYGDRFHQESLGPAEGLGQPGQGAWLNLWHTPENLFLIDD